MLGVTSLLAAALFAVSPAQHGPAQLHGPLDTGDASRSSNWSGYVVTASDTAAAPATFTDVTGVWTQPEVSCRVGSSAASGFWVGLGGFSEDSTALEQIGTSSDCRTSGRPTYYAWFEIIPSPPVLLSLKIFPHDKILGAVAVLNGQLLLELKDITRGRTVTKTVDVASPDLTSAELIAEAPSMCSTVDECQTVPLARFGRVTFSRAAVTGDGHTGTLDDPAWLTTPIVLVPDNSALATGNNQAGASPSALTADGRGFTVTWGISAAP